MILKVTMLLFFVLLSGCASILPPYHLTEVAFVRIYNNTADDITYQAHMFSQWTEMIPVKSNKIDFLFEYDRESKSESLPEKIHQLKINLTNCQLMLNRQQLESNMVQPIDKSAGWNLYVNQELIDKIGCE